VVKDGVAQLFDVLVLAFGGVLMLLMRLALPRGNVHQGREFIANGALENGAFCTVFSENFHKF
jgi:hypothetical protein